MDLDSRMCAGGGGGGGGGGGREGDYSIPNATLSPPE